MPIARISALQNLVSCLSKAEKRHFMLFAGRLSSNNEALFIKLFHALDAAPDKSDSYYRKKIAAKNNTQYSNTKRHLFSQLLKALRIFHDNSDPNFRLRQKLDYANILYAKGLYHESLSLLNSVIDRESPTSNIIYLEIAELHKKIESRHITRSRQNKDSIENLVASSSKLSKLASIEVKMANVSLEVQGLYIKWGFAKDDRDAMMYQVYFQSLLPKYDLVSPSITATILWHQAHVWYHYMNLRFHLSYKHSARWIAKMAANERIVEEDPALILRAFHYILTCCFYLNRKDKFLLWMEKYKDFRSSRIESFNGTTASLDFCYYKNAEINAMIISNKYPKLSAFTLDLESSIKGFKEQLDIHRVMMFNFKLSLMYIYKGDYEKAIDYLNTILDNKEQRLRADITNYARLLLLTAHYKINNFALVLNLLPNVKVAFESTDRMNPVIEIIISFLRRGSRAMNFGIDDLIDQSIEKLKNQRKSRFNKVAFLYFDFISWMSSVKSGNTIEKVRKYQV